MTELFNLAAQVKLTRRLKNLLRIDEATEIDMGYITCAEYQLFLDEKRENGENLQPDHWSDERFLPGDAKKPVVGVRVSDAEVFCEWLTQHYAAPGFRYRLPTVSEVQEHSIAESQIGCWCKEDGSKVIAGIELIQWETWREKVVKLFDQILDYILERGCEIARARDTDINTETLDVALTLSRNFTQSRVQKIDLARDISFARACDINIDIVHDITHAYFRIEDQLLNPDLDILSHARNIANIAAGDITISFERVRALVLALAIDIDLTLAWDITHSRNAARDITLNIDSDTRNPNDTDPKLTLQQQHDLLQLTLALQEIRSDFFHIKFLDYAFDIDLAFVLNQIRKADPALNHIHVRNHQTSPLHKFHVPVCLNLLLTFSLWASLEDAYSRLCMDQKYLTASNLTLQSGEQMRLESVTKADQVFNLYAFWALTTLRRKEQMPAWEGIRIMRERVDLE